ncbi:hypothetical protein CDAR_26621 [Caerostris darwini]|uniref:Uncharacterized protein n=1 Tax=Caerostris darwini TaxID=1538125 RepID=A0AAV4QFJ5_9ARAC|nr:hypothetical protein CDAR_26621 [Caerostris darwini]
MPHLFVRCKVQNRRQSNFQGSFSTRPDEEDHPSNQEKKLRDVWSKKYRLHLSWACAVLSPVAFRDWTHMDRGRTGS